MDYEVLVEYAGIDAIEQIPYPDIYYFWAELAPIFN